MSWLSRKSVGFTGLLVAAAATVMFLSLSIMAPADQSSPSDQAAGAGDEGSNTEEVLTSPASTPPESLSLAGSDPVPQPQGPTSVASPTSASPTPVEAPVAPEGLSGASGSTPRPVSSAGASQVVRDEEVAPTAEPEVQRSQPDSAPPSGERLVYDWPGIATRIVVTDREEAGLLLEQVVPGSGWDFEVEENGPDHIEIVFTAQAGDHEVEWSLEREDGFFEVEFDA